MLPSGTSRVFRSNAARRRFLLHAVLAVLVLAIVVATVLNELPFLLEPDEARSAIERFGLLAPVVIVLLQAAQVLVAPIPGQVLGVVAGYLYGPWWGTAYNMAGVTLGSTVAFGLSRRYGRPYVEEIVDADLLAAFDDVGDDHVQATLFLAFLVPGLPDDVLCFVGGITTIPLQRLVLLAVVGRTPAFFLVNVLGASLGAGEVGLAGALGLALVGASGLGYLYRDRILPRRDPPTNDE